MKIAELGNFRCICGEPLNLEIRLTGGCDCRANNNKDCYCDPAGVRLVASCPAKLSYSNKKKEVKHTETFVVSGMQDEYALSSVLQQLMITNNL